jgi:formamidopyrimidine-DNA glycosylase
MVTVPELPEVEALAQFLRGRMDGHAVTEVSIGAISALKTFRPPPDALVGGTVVDVQRHGKWLDVMVATPTGEPLHLIWHLSRAGWVRWSEQLSTNPVRPGKSPLALRVRLDDGSGFDLTEAGTRKRLAVHVVEDPSDVPQIATLGVEPLSDEFTEDRLADLLAARNQQVKGLLRDQGTIAGIGNAYSDEILLAARMSPFAMTRSFDADRTRILWEAIREVLTGAVQSASGKPATELKDAKRRGMKVHGRTGQPCPGWNDVPCGDTVHEVSFADSSLQYCPTCQTGGKPLADRRMSRLLR